MKSYEECYGKGGAALPYEDFVASRINELPGRSPVVSLVQQLPLLIAETISDRARLFRPLSVDETQAFGSLQSAPTISYFHRSYGGPRFSSVGPRSYGEGRDGDIGSLKNFVSP